MGDFLSVARLVGQVAISMAAMAGHGAHRTAVDNARRALAEAHRRSEERREADAVLTSLAPPTGTARVPGDGSPARAAVP